MSKTYRAWNPDQNWLLPPSPRQWLPEGDLVYFLMDVVKELDLSAFTSVYERSDRGYPPFHPRMMTCLLIYSYAMGVRSSRQIALRCERDAAWRVIVGEDIPDFRTISLFRKLHLEAFSKLFVQVLQLCQEAGLVKVGHLSLDGTKVKANASRHKAMSYGRMKQEESRLQEEIQQILTEAQAEDEQEDVRYGKDRRGDELPEELARRQSRLQRIQQAKAALQARVKEEAQAEAKKKQEAEAQAKKKRQTKGQEEDAKDPASPGEAVQVADKTQYNFTDPESRIMKTSNKGWDQCGNAQVVVDGQQQVIVAADVTNQTNDCRQVEPMLTQAQQNVGPEASLGKVSMDAGYFSEDNVRWMEKEQIDGYVATGRLQHGEKVSAAPRGRIPEGLSVKERMARKLRTRKGRATYARRKAIVEPVIGQLKRVMGFTQFLLRGLGQMQGEWRLACLSYNLRKLHRVRVLAAG